MAEAIGIIGSILAIANSAATLSRALFDLVESIKNARKEIAYIAQQLSFLSGSLNTLADVISSQQDLFKAALYSNTNSILGQYRLVDNEVRKLVETPRTLARLTWCIKRTKVKSLLREIEAIKTLLTLELNIIQLAREELHRPLSGYSASKSDVPQPNRFRRLVESAVQANRQVVESAQRDEAEEAKKKYTHIHAELDVYKEGSFDTATWLYHLVFSLQIPDPPTYSPPENGGSKQASVSDDGSECIVRRTNTIHGSNAAHLTSNSSGHGDKAMTVWSRQTEPSRVVDRLLSSWTTLTDSQIALSATGQTDDEWRKSFLRKVAEVKESETDFEKWEEEWSSDATNDLDFESAGEESVIDEVSAAYRTNRPFDKHATSTSSSRQGAASNEPQTDAGRHSRPKRKSSGKQRQQQAGLWTDSSTQEQDYQSHSANKSSAEYIAMPIRHGTVSGHDKLFGLPLPPSNPFVPNGFTHHYNPQKTNRRSNQDGMGSDVRNAQPSTSLHNPESHWPFSASHPTENLPMSTKAPPPPPPAPPPPSSHVFTKKDEIEAEMLARKTTDKEDAVLAAVMKLLDKGERQQTANVDDPRFTKMLQLLITQQEQQAQFGLEQARVVAEAEMKLILAARDKDDADLRRLEKVIIQQGEDQRKAEAMWRAERVAQERKAAEQAREVKALMEKDIEAARSAEKAARKALKHAKAEAEKKAEAEAEQRTKKEKQDVDDKFRELSQRYGETLESKAAKQLKAQCNGGYPVRRTFMSNGDRSMEVAEYAATTRELHSSSSLLTAAFFQEDIFAPQPPRRHDESSFASASVILVKFITQQLRYTHCGRPQQTLEIQRLRIRISK